jgi:hypothetical protein
MMTTSIAVMHIPYSLMIQLSRLARIIGLLAVTAALAACSAIKLGYNNLDEVAYWWLDGYVDFSDEQTPRIREDLSRLQSWHRVQELPHLEAMLRDMEELATREISAAQACAFVPRLFERLNALTQRAEPALVTLALGLAPEQVAHLERKYSKNNAQFRKDWVRLPAAEQQEKRFKQFLERSEMIYGRLDETQRATMGRQTEQSIFDARRILAERERRQQDALHTLRKLAGQPVTLGEARALLRAYLERVQMSPDAAYRSYQQALIDEGCRNAAVLHNSTSPAQREAAVRRLRAYQRDLRELSGQP